MEAATSQSMRHFYLGGDGKKLSIRERGGGAYHAIKEHIGYQSFLVRFSSQKFCSVEPNFI